MGTNWYTKEAQYILPAWSAIRGETDALYIDGVLWSNNIPVLDNIVWISVQPDGTHSFRHHITFYIPTFNRATNKVDYILQGFWWWPWEDHEQSNKVFCNGNPYGMGLNLFQVMMEIELPITRDIIYDVSLMMEVTV